ncbi:MAG: hypothetical protein LBF56_03330 [Holosporales bacterium]|nr:hypothetical protein [Holosporales bacterium]
MNNKKRNYLMASCVLLAFCVRGSALAETVDLMVKERGSKQVESMQVDFENGDRYLIYEYMNDSAFADDLRKLDKKVEEGVLTKIHDTVITDLLHAALKCRKEGTLKDEPYLGNNFIESLPGYPKEVNPGEATEEEVAKQRKYAAQVEKEAKEVVQEAIEAGLLKGDVVLTGDYFVDGQPHTGASSQIYYISPAINEVIEKMKKDIAERAETAIEGQS